MKQVLGGAAAVITIAWLLFVFATPESCERIKRGAAPVRATMDLSRWATNNWLSIEGRIDMLRWSLKADSATQRFLSHHFYGEQLCTATKVSAEPNATQPKEEGKAEAAQQ